MRVGAVILGAIVTVLALAGVGALYAMGGGGGAEGQYRTTLGLLREIQQLSSNWSIETARVKSDPLADFDSLAAFVPRMTRLKQNLAASVRQIPDLPDRLAGDLRAYSSAVDAKEERIERFKTDYAVVRNSTNYFPLAAASLVQQAEAAAVGDVARTVAAIASDMSTYLMTPTDTGRSRLAAALQALRAASGEYPLPVANALVDFISHGEILLDRKEAAEELFREATSSDLSDLTNRLAGRLQLELDRREVATRYYQHGMVAVIGVLVLFWIGLLMLRKPRGGPPAIDEAFQPSTEPAPTPEAAVDSAVRFESSWSEAPAEAGARDSTLAIEGDARAGDEAEFFEDERPARGGAPSAAGGVEEIVFVEDGEPSGSAAVGETIFVGGEERPSGEDGAPARGEAPSAAAAADGEAVFVEDEDPSSVTAIVGETIFVGGEERPSGEDEAPARGEAPSAAAATGGEAASVEDEPPSMAAVGETIFVGRDERRPSGEDEPPIRAGGSTVPGGEAVSAEDDAASGKEGPAARSAAVAAAEDELLAIRELLLRIEEEPPAATEGEPPLPASGPRTTFPPAGGEAPRSGAVEEPPPSAPEVVFEPPAPAAPAGEVVTSGGDAPAAAGEAPWSEAVEEPLPSAPEAVFEPPAPAASAGEVVTSGGDAPAAAGEGPRSGAVEEPPPSASEAVFEPPAPAASAGEVVASGGDAPAAAGEGPRSGAVEEPPPSASEAVFEPPAPAASAGEVVASGGDAPAAGGEGPRSEAVEEPPPSAPEAVFEPPAPAAAAGEVVASGGDAPAAAGEGPWPPVEEPPLLVPEGRSASRADSLQETRNRIREALGAGAAIVDLRVRTDPDAEVGAASLAASDLRRDVRRIAELLGRITSSPHLPDGGAGRGGVDVNACIDEAVRTTGAEAAAAVERDLRPVPGVSGSKAGVRLLLAEIVENSVLAVQAQHERPPAIRIHTSRRNDDVLVTIIDNGIGIPADAREAVFHPFHTSRDGSIGVGLTLARCLAERHEGAVRINSSLHHGTVARITLPVERPVS